MRRVTDFDFGVTWLMDAFHQDWRSCIETEVEAVRHQLVDDLDPRQVVLVRRDAVMLIDRLPSDSIEKLWESGLQLSFFGRGVPSGARWMQLITQECDRWLSLHGSVSLDGADQEVGYQCADAVLSELEDATDLVGFDLKAELAQCLNNCTPDLAFRFFLRALMGECLKEGRSINHHRYERLNGIGRCLLYGEFLVSRIEFLVE